MKTFKSVLEDFFKDKDNVDFLNSINDYSGFQISSYLLSKGDLNLTALAYIITRAMPNISKLIWENPKLDMWRLAWYVNDEFVNSLMTEIIDDKSEVTDLDENDSILNMLGIPRHKGDKLCDYLYYQLVYSLQNYYKLDISFDDLVDLVKIIDDSEIDLKASKYEE